MEDLARSLAGWLSMVGKATSSRSSPPVCPQSTVLLSGISHAKDFDADALHGADLLGQALGRTPGASDLDEFVAFQRGSFEGLRSCVGRAEENGSTCRVPPSQLVVRSSLMVRDMQRPLAKQMPSCEHVCVMSSRCKHADDSRRVRSAISVRQLLCVNHDSSAAWPKACVHVIIAKGKTLAAALRVAIHILVTEQGDKEDTGYSSC
eukprot:6466034-Amphidinium_carterae.1